jgi:hypothetical protein
MYIRKLAFDLELIFSRPTLCGDWCKSDCFICNRPGGAFVKNSSDGKYKPVHRSTAASGGGYYFDRLLWANIHEVENPAAISSHRMVRSSRIICHLPRYISQRLDSELS